VFVFASVTAAGSGFQENVNRDPDPGNPMRILAIWIRNTAYQVDEVNFLGNNAASDIEKA
jgi:hypothetical protein